jgi:hypothetical protein
VGAIGDYIGYQWTAVTPESTTWSRQ